MVNEVATEAVFYAIKNKAMDINLRKISHVLRVSIEL